MARQQAAVEINAFIKGLITEASPLTFPDNASIDELNLIPQKDGSRKRRLGMDFEDGFQGVYTGSSASSEMIFSAYQWKSPGGFSDKEICVIQTGSILTFFDSSSLPLSQNVLAAYDTGSLENSRVSVASVDGLLIVTSGTVDIFIYDYNGSSISRTQGRLKIRDLFGVEDKIGGTDLVEGSGVAIRPGSTTSNHNYNLRNQTFAYERYNGNEEIFRDPIESFSFAYNARYGRSGYPSNSDNLVTFLYADANDSGDRNIRRYFAGDNVSNPLGTNRAPLGYFIIDALNRGASRMEQVGILESRYQSLVHRVLSLPADRTPGGATVVASYAGRVFYGGFSSQIIDGDSQSPRMTSYVLFSRLVQGTSDVLKCYQEGDPTSSETPDLVDTDGGFLRIDGAYNIKKLINVGDALMVVAENGLWTVTGGSGYGFKATDYLVSKITEHGSISPGSVVVLDNTLMYWSDDGIYHAVKNQYGDWEAQNLTTSTIQKLYDAIPYVDKTRCEGSYDGYTRQVRWLYHNYYGAIEAPRELVLDVGLGAFYPSKISTISSEFPRVVSTVKVPPFQSTITNTRVVSNSGDIVKAIDGSGVAVREEIELSSLSETYYITLTGEFDGKAFYSFGLYKDEGFVDWRSYNTLGVDAEAYLVTGWTGMGDFQRQKQISYLTVYSSKTETGFTVDYVPVNASSIKIRSQWNWTNSATSGKWGEEFEAYRHKRLWTPANSSSGFDDGDAVVVTKNKLRGRGRVLSLKFNSSPGKDFHLLGWGFSGSVNGSV